MDWLIWIGGVLCVWFVLALLVGLVLGRLMHTDDD